MKLEITQEKWHFVVQNRVIYILNDVNVLVAELDVIQHHSKYMMPIPSATQANAELIADAGTTANKCQLLPSELLVQRDELLKSLIEVIEFNEITFKRLGRDYTKMIDLAKTRINKSLGL